MKRGRAIQLAVVAVAIAGSVAYSISGHDVVARPRMAIVMVTPGLGATAPIAIEDRGDAGVSIDSTRRAASCDPEVTATPAAFALDGFEAQTITVHCAPLATFTMRRCDFTALDAGEPVVSYAGLCIARGTSSLSPSTLAVSLAVRPNQASAWASVAFTTPLEMSSASVQLDDPDGIFEVKTPCHTPWGCSDYAAPTRAGAAFSVDLACHPHDANPHSTHVHVLTNTGAEAVVRVDCNVASQFLAGSGGPPDAPIVPDALDAMMMMVSDAPIIPDAPGEGGFPDAPDDGSIGADATFDLDASVDAGVSMISVTPPALTIPAMVGGNGSADITFAEIGSAPVTINTAIVGGPNAAVFSVTPGSGCNSVLPCVLGPGAQTLFHVVYQPTAAGTDTAIVTFASTDPTQPSVTVTLTGNATPANANISLVAPPPPNPLAFGNNVQVNQTATLQFTLANTGTVALTGVAMTLPDAPFALTVAPTSIPGGGMASGTVTCHPTSSGVFSDVIHITAPNAMTGSPIDLQLTCSTPPKLDVTPPSVTIATHVNTLGFAGVTITNTGASPLTLTTVALQDLGLGWSEALGSACFSGLPCVLAAGQMVNVDLMFSPTAIQAYDTVLHIQSDGGNVDVPLDGTGQGATLALHGGGPTTLDFGDIVVTSSRLRTLQLDNAGNIPLTRVSYDLMQPNGGFFLDVGPMEVPATTAGATVTVRCTPAVVMPYTGMLAISSPDAVIGGPIMVNLICNGVTASTGPQLAISQSPISGSAEVTGTPYTTTTILTDSGTMPLAIQSIMIMGSPQWSLSAPCITNCTLMPNGGDSETVTLTYTPTAIAGNDVAMLTIISNDPSDPGGMRNVMLTGMGLGATFAVVPTTPLDFGTLAVGTSMQRSFQLANTGNEQLTNVTYVLSSGPYHLDTAPAFVDAGTMPFVRVSCMPTTAGQANGTLAVSSAVGTTVTVMLTCAGQNGGLAAFPTSLDFGEIRIGDTAPRTKQTALSSTGSPLVVTAQPALTTAVPGLVVGTVPMTITSTPAMLDVTYTPPDAETSFATTVATTANNTATVAITGKVVMAAVDGGIEVRLGSWCTGQQPTPTLVALTSTGTATVHVAQPTLGGTAFALADTMPPMAGYPYALPSGGTVTVAITPQVSNAVGHVTDTLAWNADIPATTTLTVDYVNSTTDASVDHLAYQTITGMDSETQLVTFSNCGDAALALSDVKVSPDNVYRIDTPLPGTIPPGVAGAIGVSFHPDHVGVDNGELTFQMGARLYTVPLVGTGLGGEDSSGTPKTFYGCGCRSSEPGTPIILGLALLVVRRRRRR